MFSVNVRNGSTEQVRDVILIYVHQKYSDTTYDNDISVLVLSQSLEFSDYVSPIKLWDPAWKLPGKTHAFNLNCFRFARMQLGLIGSLFLNIKPGQI